MQFAPAGNARQNLAQINTSNTFIKKKKKKDKLNKAYWPDHAITSNFKKKKKKVSACSINIEAVFAGPVRKLLSWHLGCPFM